MAKFLYTYHGGTYPEDEAEAAKVMDAWSTWMAGLGEALVDGGAPIGQWKTIATDGSVTTGEGPEGLNGYSLVEAATIDDAVAMAKGCPHLDAGGTVRVGECHQM